MSPESTESHNKPKSKIARVLSALIDDEDLGEAYSDGVLLTNEAAGLSTEPDLVFVSWTTIDTGRLRLVEEAARPGDYVELVGTPDLVVEVVSDASVRKDRTLLFEAYARAEVPEYWLVDARREIEFQNHRFVDGGYRPAGASGEPQASAVLGRSFRLTRAPNRVGRFRYALEVTR